MSVDKIDDAFLLDEKLTKSAVFTCEYFQDTLEEELTWNSSGATKLAKSIFDILMKNACRKELSVQDLEAIYNTGVKALNYMNLGKDIYMFKYNNLGMRILTAIAKNSPNCINGYYLEFVTTVLKNFGSFIPGKCLTFPCEIEVFDWVLQILGDSEFCNSVYTRGEVMKVINRWPKHIYNDADKCKDLFFNLMAWTNDYIIERNNDDCEIQNIYFILNNYICIMNKIGSSTLEGVAASIIKQIDNFVVGTETRWFINVFDILHETLNSCQHNIKIGLISNSSAFCIIFQCLELFCRLFAYPAMDLLWTSATLCKYFSFIFVSLVGSVLVVGNTLPESKREALFRAAAMIQQTLELMSSEFNYCENSLSLTETTALYLENLKDDFKVFTNKMKLDIDLDIIPVLNNQGNVPPSYLDSITKRIMVAPVLINSTCSVVDESTIIHSLYNKNLKEMPNKKSNFDFEKLDQLQQEIKMWCFPNLNGVNE